MELICAQTRQPSEITIVDSSDDITESKTSIEEVLAGNPAVKLNYIHSEIKSSSTQRNTGISHCTADVIFFLDDDSFLHPDCAEKAMTVYESDVDAEIAGLSLRNTPMRDAKVDGIEMKESGKNQAMGLYDAILSTAIGRFIDRKILMQSTVELFLQYNGSRVRQLPGTVSGLAVEPTAFLPGYGMTVRRDIAVREQFDPDLRFYAAFEDLDVGYRAASHGALARSGDAKVHHFETAAARVKRKTVVIFQLLNMIIFIKKHAAKPETLRSRYRLLLARRLLAEFLKDTLSRRFSFPQTAGVLFAMKNWRTVWDSPTETISEWYPNLQSKIRSEIT